MRVPLLANRVRYPVLRRGVLGRMLVPRSQAAQGLPRRGRYAITWGSGRRAATRRPPRRMDGHGRLARFFRDLRILQRTFTLVKPSFG